MKLLVLAIGMFASYICVNGETPIEWHRSQFPNPQQESNATKACGRGKISWICDPNNLLSETEANQLDMIIEKVYAETRCPCSEYACGMNQGGYRIAIGLVTKMVKENKDEEETDETAMIDENLHQSSLFANKLLNSWDLGRCKEGVVIFYSLKDNALYTVTDEVAMRTLTPSHIGDISMNKRHLFNSQNLAEGLRQVIADYKKVFNGEYQARKVGNVEPEDPQAVVGGASLSITSLLLLIGSALSALILLC